jgi:hypothetical protein
VTLFAALRALPAETATATATAATSTPTVSFLLNAPS